MQTVMEISSAGDTRAIGSLSAIAYQEGRAYASLTTPVALFAPACSSTYALNACSLSRYVMICTISCVSSAKQKSPGSTRNKLVWQLLSHILTVTQ